MGAFEVAAPGHVPAVAPGIGRRGGGSPTGGIRRPSHRATHTLLADGNDVPAKIRRITGGRGADVAFEAVGATSALEIATASLAKGGALALIGNLASRVELALQQAVTRELSIYGSCASAGEYEKGLDLLARGAVDVAPLISAVAPLAEGALWFERLLRSASELIKVVLVP